MAFDVAGNWHTREVPRCIVLSDGGILRMLEPLDVAPGGVLEL